MSNLHDTQPRGFNRSDELAAPPRFLMWGLILLFVIVVGGLFAGVFIFRNVLQPGQQQRVMNMAPFMEAFLYREPTPAGGVLPTPEAAGGGENDPLALLDIEVDGSPTAEPATPSPQTIEPTETSVAVVPPTATPTMIASPTPTLTPTWTPSPVPTEISAPSDQPVSAVSNTSSLPDSARMNGFRWYRQTWNNCGPTNATIALSYYGWQEEPDYAEPFLKPKREDKNVSPDEIVRFINEETGVRALARMGGDLQLIKTLIANEFPVIVETSAMFEAYDWIGHYRTPVAYDDLTGSFYIYDSFQGIGNGEGAVVGYSQFDAEWRQFNRIFIVIYQQEEEDRLARLLGDRYEQEAAAQHAFTIAQEEARENPNDSFAWFNMGTSLVELGRYQEAATAFDSARRLELPWRMLWYQFGPYQAYYEMGRYDDILSLAQGTFNNLDEHEETSYWQGRALAAQGNSSEAATAFRQAIRANPLFTDARDALDALGS